MTKNSILAGGALLAVALTTGIAPAQAKKPHPTKYCTPKNVGFHAKGKFVSGSLTQTAGADTPSRKDDRYSGEITVDVKRANHGAPKGEQTYTLDNSRVRVHPRTHSPTAGDRVHVFGKLTKIRGRKCENTGVTVSKVRRVGIKAPKA